MHIVGFIKKKFVTMHGHTNVKYGNENLCSLKCAEFFDWLLTKDSALWR